jgi:Rieske Fe-S protein
MTDQHVESKAGISRRTVVVEGCLAAGVVTLAGCAAYDTSVEAPTTEKPTDNGASGDTASSIAATADVPVGGGVVVKDKKIVVTQPTSGEFKGFTAVCTHAGCIVGTVAGGTINCPCHGSKYSITDGSVVNGPAKAPLAEIPVTVDGGEIVSA